MIKLLVLSAALLPGLNQFAGSARAQGGPPNFDPAEFRQRMMDRFREQFEVKSDDEWKIIQDRLEKVMAARMAGGGFGFPGMGGPGGPGGGPGGGRRSRGGPDGPDGGPGGPPPDGGPGGPPPGGGPGGRSGPGGPGFGGMGRQSAETQALREAVEAKAPPEEIKARLAKLREARKAGEAKLEAAQADLVAVLNVRQEAVAVMAGLLK
jgi:hypothetical protein